MRLPETPKPNQQLKEIFDTYDRGTKTLILGMSRCGKSTLGKMASLLNYPRVLVIDIMGEYEGFETVKSIPQLIKKLMQLKNESRFFLVYQFKLNSKDKEEIFNQICEICFYFKNIHVNIEEIDQYCSPHEIPQWLENLLRRGRHHNVSLTMSTQTPSNLNKMCVKQADHIFIGMLKEQNDVNYASNLMIGQREKLLQLKPREFLHEHMREIKAITTNQVTD